MRRSDQTPERNRSSGVPTTGSSSARYLKQRIARWSSSNRTCQKHVFPLKIAALPPPSVNPSSVSRMPHDQYSSWPTLDVQPVTLEHLGVLLEILTDRDVDAEALLARPIAGRAAPSSTTRRRRSRPKARAARPTRSTSVPSRSGSGCILRRAGSGLTRKPRASGRSNETRLPPVYSDGPPQSLYAFQVDVDSTSRIGSRGAPGAGRTTRNASARSVPAVSVTE